MRMPIPSIPVVRNRRADRTHGTVAPSGCSVLKKVACAGAIAACGAVCVGSLGTACAECLAGIGASGCIDCF